MANIKIGDLVTLTDPISTDVLPIVDVSADTTNKISIEELLKNAAAGTAALPAFAFDADPNTGMYRSGADALAFSTGGTGRLFINASGNIGVGTGSPSGLFDARGFSYLSGAQIRDSSHVAKGYVQGDARGFLLATDGSTNIVFDVNGAERLRIDSSGRLGIGTSSPAHAVHIAGATTPELIVEDTTNNVKAVVGADNTVGRIGTDTNHALTLRTNDTERMRIDSSGNVGIGTPSVSSPGSYGKTVQVSNSDSSSVVLSRTSATAHSLEIGVFSGASLIESTGATSLRFKTNGSEAMRIDSSGRVGIGTGSPSAPLVVNHTSTSGTDQDVARFETQSGGDLKIQASDLSSANPTWKIYTPGNEAITLGANNGEAIYIDGSNNVGIGATTVDRHFHVEGTANVQGKFQNNASLCLIEFEDVNTTAGNRPSFGSVGNEAVIHAAGSERMRIDSSGRLLVGTSSNRTNYNLQIEGTTGAGAGASFIRNEAGNSGGTITLGKSGGTSNGSFALVSNNDTLGSIIFTGADGTASRNGAFIQAQVDGTPGANDMPGRLVFSTTADGASSPTERMRISNNGTLNHFSSGGNALDIASSSTAGTDNNLIRGVYSSTGVGTGSSSFFVRTNGNVQNTNNSYGAISDAKLKENIVDASSQWDDIKALQVRNYNFIEGQTHTQIGVVAQEVETVSPGLVNESSDFDEEGNDLGTTTKSVNYSVLYMKAVKALQEAMERIETLESKVAALEAAN